MAVGVAFMFVMPFIQRLRGGEGGEGGEEGKREGGGYTP